MVKGFTQRKRIDYNETFSPVVKMTTIRSLIVIAVKKKWAMFHMDVNNALLHGDLHEEIYMKTPPSLTVSNKNNVSRLNKSLYGFKQTSQQWYSKLFDALMTKGYHNSKNNCSLFYKAMA